MKVIGIICIVLAAVITGVVVLRLCAADEDDFSEWEKNDGDDNA